MNEIAIGLIQRDAFYFLIELIVVAIVFIFYNNN